MAEAKTTIVKVVQEVDGVSLTLTPDEAQVIADILMRVGGDPDKSRRGLADNIRSALHSVNVYGKNCATELDKDTFRSSIRFH